MSAEAKARWTAERPIRDRLRSRATDLRERADQELGAIASVSAALNALVDVALEQSDRFTPASEAKLYGFVTRVMGGVVFETLDSEPGAVGEDCSFLVTPEIAEFVEATLVPDMSLGLYVSTGQSEMPDYRRAATRFDSVVLEAAFHPNPQGVWVRDMRNVRMTVLPHVAVPVPVPPRLGGR